MSDELTVIPQSSTQIEFGSFRSPDQALKEAEMVAAAFKRRANAMNLYQPIGESKHLKIEGWQMLASMYRVTASVGETRYLEIGDARGWEATAHAIYVPTGQKISSADAMCMDDEDKWGMVSKYEYVNGQKTKTGDVHKPLQQLRSMAQTRACSKVLSNLLKWVAVMSGFAPTPAEEMTGSDDTSDQPRAASGGGGEPQRTNGGPVITEPQGKRLFALTKASGKTKDEVTALLAHFGFASDRDVTKAKYDAVCTAVQDPNWRPAPAPAAQSQPAAAGQTQQRAATSDDIWAEVVRTYKGEARALRALNDAGFTTWSQVNISDQPAVAMKLIEDEKRW
jgi:hypothetical protein